MVKKEKLTANAIEFIKAFKNTTSSARDGVDILCHPNSTRNSQRLDQHFVELAKQFSKEEREMLIEKLKTIWAEKFRLATNMGGFLVGTEKPLTSSPTTEFDHELEEGPVSDEELREWVERDFENRSRFLPKK